MECEKIDIINEKHNTFQSETQNKEKPIDEIKR